MIQRLETRRIAPAQGIIQTEQRRTEGSGLRANYLRTLLGSGQAGSGANRESAALEADRKGSGVDREAASL